MTERTLKQLVGALAIALAIWGVMTVFSGGAGSIGATGEISDFFDGIDGGTVESISIDRPAESIELARSGGAWTVNGFPADSDAVSQLLDVLGELEVGDLIATNPANHERMGVSDDVGTTVAFTVGSGSSSLLVGEAGRRYGTAYVRLPGEDGVYLLEGDLRAQLSRGLDTWRNRTMIALDSTAIARIEVDGEDGSYALERGDSAWTFEGGAQVADQAVNGILAELSRLVATGFVAEGDSIGALAQGSATRAFSSSGALLGEIIFGQGDGDRWARTSADGYLYRVSSFRAGRVAPTREDAEPGS